MSRQEVGVGCLLVVAALVTAALAVTIGSGSIFERTIQVTLPVADAAGLQRGAEVKVVGVVVGEVSEVRLDNERALLVLSLRQDQPIHQGSARLRSRSVLGEWYVELVPGPQSAPLLADGDVLAQTGQVYEIDELVDGLGPLLAAVDPETLRLAGASLSQALEEDPEALAKMLKDAQTTLHHTSVAAEELPALLQEGKAAVVEARSAARTLDQRGREAAALMARADRLMAELERSAEPLPETVEALRLAIEDSRRVLATLEGSSGELSTMLEQLNALDESDLTRVLREGGIRVRLFGPGKDLKPPKP